jgi:hypothetical protein
LETNSKTHSKTNKSNGCDTTYDRSSGASTTRNETKYNTNDYDSTYSCDATDSTTQDDAEKDDDEDVRTTHIRFFFVTRIFFASILLLEVFCE